MGSGEVRVGKVLVLGMSHSFWWMIHGPNSKLTTDSFKSFQMVFKNLNFLQVKKHPGSGKQGESPSWGRAGCGLSSWGPSGLLLQILLSKKIDCWL